MIVTSILRRPDTSYFKPYFQLVKTSPTCNDLTQNFPCQVSASGRILWCSMVCLFFFFFPFNVSQSCTFISVSSQTGKTVQNKPGNLYEGT